METLSEHLKSQLHVRGCDLVGFASFEDVAEDVRPALPRAVVIAIALTPRIIDGIRQGPTQEYFDLYNTANARLNVLGEFAARILSEAGAHTEFRPSSIIDRSTFNRETLSVGFSHKMAATRAGLGWIGKCALLVTPEYGSAVRFATVLTDAELPTGTPVVESRCGVCRNCVDICPGHAPSGKNWDPSFHREDFFDAHACLDSILARNTQFGTVCGMCIAACPWTERYLRKSLGAESPTS